jgi:tetratricopeptide (TPR) repeat protein/predicted Ser/Thr protein kinase
MSHRRIGKYDVQNELGRGTMGEVYRAFDPDLKRFVALKTMMVSPGEPDETLERFRREARAAALLNHPNIVTVYDYGKEGQQRYIAMELLKGTDLREAIDNGTLKTLDEKLDVMDGVLAALEYAHAEGVVHRDIKPANIHLGPGRHVKLMDFGLARVEASEMTQEGIVLGTPNYMSPEQALGDRVDARTDLFSVGAILFELVTGHKPFEAESTPSVLFQVVHKDAPPVRRWAPDAPAAVCDLVRIALHKNREARYQSATEMRAALAETRRGSAAAADRSLAPPLPVLANGPTLRPGSVPPPLPDRGRAADGTIAPTVRRSGAPPVSAPAPVRPAARRDARRRPSPAALLAASGLGILALAAVVGLWARRSPEPAPTPSAPTAQVDQLTEALVSTQLQLARRELDNKNYAAAAKQAESALGLSPGHPEAERVLGEARERTRELEEAVTSARQLAEQGDSAGASQQLSRVLDLDPRHPAAAELSARLNGVFRAQADGAAQSMQKAQAQATAAGARTDPAFAAAADRAVAAAARAARGEFADATRAYLDARDGFERAGRAARLRAAAAPAPAERPRDSGAPPVSAPPDASVSTRAPAESDSPTHAFSTERTVVSPASAAGPAGFEGGEARRPVEFAGRLLFQVVPTAVHAGDPFVVRLRLVNEGRRPVRVRSLEAVVLAAGRRTTVDAKIVQREVEAQREAIVAEYSGEWHETGPWMLEALVVTDRGEKIASRLRSNP